MYDSIPKRPKNDHEKEQLDNSDENKPVEKHNCAHGDLKHDGIKVLLSCYADIWVGCITLARWQICAIQKDRVAVEEPDCKEHNLQHGHSQGILEENVVSEPAQDWNPQNAKKRETGEAYEID